MPELNVYNHQSVIDLTAGLCDRLRSCGRKALEEVLQLCTRPAGIRDLDEIEVSFVDDETIAELHLQFMGLAGPTDVITFDHGEIHISVETAMTQAREYANDFERELMLYIVHGLLHLAGYDDATERESALMEDMQSTILSNVW